MRKTSVPTPLFSGASADSTRAPQPIQAAGPAYALETITPEIAQQWLAMNTHNRNLRQRVVNGYAADMASGNWVEDGQAIKFSSEGVLLDGQHRLAAIAQSGISIRMLVVRNLSIATQETMDTGAKRTLADVLKLRGEKNYVGLSSALFRVNQWEKGLRKAVASGNDVRPTHRQLLQTLDEHPELRHSVEVAIKTRVQIPISVAPLSLCHWLFNQINTDDCDFFYGRLGDGVGLMKEDAIYALRRAADLNARGTGTKYNEVHMIALVIKAWNAYRMGTAVKLLAYRPGGANQESFPEPK